MSNRNLNNTINAGNTGRVKTQPTLGVIRAIVLVPVGTTIPASAQVSQAAFQTYVSAKFIADSRTSRWFGFNNLDKFNDETKKTATEDTGRLQLDVYSFPSKFSFRYMTGIGNNIEALKFKNCQGNYDFYVIDDGGFWWGWNTTGGALAPYTNQQFYIPNWMPATVSTAAQFTISISLADVKQINENFGFYNANTSPDAIVMLENAVCQDVTATLGTPLSITTTTTAVITIKAGEDTQDLIQAYSTVLTAGCLKAYNTTTAAAATIASATFGFITVASQGYWYAKVVLSVAPAAGDVVQFYLQAPSVTNAVIPNFNCVSEVIDPTADGQNYAVHTF